MITYLEGILAAKLPASAVIDVGGVGYDVLISLSSYDRLPAEGERVRILTHYHIREDAHLLYGFMTEDERRMFRMLIDVSGIGPRIALGALSGLSIRELKVAILEGDSKRLSSISGIGKKTAERMVLELKDKLSKGESLEALAGERHGDAGDARLQDAAQALISLGYKQTDALKLVRKAAATAGPDAPVEDLIRRSLAG